MTISPFSRRQMLRASLLSLPAAGFLASCSNNGSGDADATGAPGGEASPDNPFGVDPSAELEVVIFDGGYGDEYAQYHQELYQEAYPDAAIDHSAIQEITQTLQPRFVSGDVPDVIDNSGANAIEMNVLVSEDQLTDLQPLLDAPSWDDPSVTVRETLIPGVVESGTFGDSMYALNYVATVYAIWYSRSLFEENGWEYPRTWEELLDLGREAKEQDVYTFSYGGTNAPDYLGRVMFHLAAKHGGVQVLKDIDNLEPNAWKSESMVQAAEALYTLVEEELILPGSDGLEHTQAQTEWVLGKALFYPSGSWIENEMSGITPEGFEMTAGPVPNLTDGDELAFEDIQVSAGEQFIVPANAPNQEGGLEYLRLMLSKDAAQRFSELTKAPTVLVGALGDETFGSTALASAASAMEAASVTDLGYRFASWYSDLQEAFNPELGNLLAGRIGPEEYLDRMQQIADRVAADDSIEKFTRD